ncbi:MAG: hypothetical protein JXQ82_10470 [Methanomicrobiaceae archaeon]|nr:hypothetical protein [Methanomicrobiaceae archaeon]
MKKKLKITGLFLAAMLCISAFVIMPAAAAPNMLGSEDRQSQQGPFGMLDYLDAQGYDTTDIRSAIESGDHDSAKELMRALMDEAGIEHKDSVNRGGFGAGPEGMLDYLDAQGYDTTNIRSAIESGNHDTVRDLMKALMNEAGIFPKERGNAFQKNRMSEN